MKHPLYFDHFSFSTEDWRTDRKPNAICGAFKKRRKNAKLHRWAIQIDPDGTSEDLAKKLTVFAEGIAKFNP